MLERVNDDYVSIGDPNAETTTIFVGRYDFPIDQAQYKAGQLLAAVNEIWYMRQSNPIDGGERWIIVLG